MIDPFLIKGFSYSSLYISNNKGFFFFVAFQLLSETNATSFLLLQSILQSKSPLWLFICWLLEFSFQKIIFINTYIVFFLLLIIFLFQIQSSIKYIYFFFTNYIEYNFNFNFFLLKIMDSYFLYCRIKFFFWVENILKFFTCFIK